MRNLKRMLSLAVAAMMLIGMMVIGASAADVYEDFTDKDEIQNKEAVATMVTLGVFEGKDDGSYFDPTGTVTRAEMAKIVAVSLSGGVDPVTGSGSNTVTFSDVPTTHWAYKYISFCVQQNIIAGRGDGTFGPEDTVTGSQAAKMFLCALGYNANIHGLVGNDWEINTNVLANQNANLYEGLNGIDASAGLSRDNTAQMAYNAVQADEVVYDSDAPVIDGVPPVKTNGTMLANRFKVVKFTGILEANDKLSVTYKAAFGNTPADYTGDGTTALEGQSRVNVTAIGDSRFNRDDYPTLYGTNSFKVATDDELVGQEIVLYVKLNNWLSPNASSSTVLGNAIITDNNTVVETTGRLKDDSAVRTALRAGGLTNVGTPVTFLFDETGRSSNSSLGVTDSIAKRNSDATRSAGVTQRFIDNDADGEAEYLIQIMPSLTSVNVVNAKSETYNFAGAGLGNIPFGDVVSEDELAKDDVLLITKYSDGKYYVSAPETVEGTVTRYNTANNTITIDDASYANGAGAKLTELNGMDWLLNEDMVGNSYRLYLDAAGNVLGYELIDAAIGNYAVVLGYTTSGSDKMGYSARVKILTETGAEATYDLNVDETAVRVDKDLSNKTSMQKNLWLFKNSGLFDVNDNDKGSIYGMLFSYSLGEDKSLTLSYPENVNKNYGRGEAAASVGSNPVQLGSGIASYSSYVVDDDTVFFIQDNAGGSSAKWSVVIGRDKLPTASNKTEFVGNAQLIWYDAPGGAVTKNAKAMKVVIKGEFSAVKDYAYIVDKPSIGSGANGTTLYTYPVVLSDGTYTELTSRSNDAVKNQVWEFEPDGDYVKFTSNSTTELFSNARIDHVQGNTMTVVNASNDKAIGTYVLSSDTVVMDVRDAENADTTTLSVNNKVAFILDSKDGSIEAIFVYDDLVGDLAAQSSDVSGYTSGSTKITVAAEKGQTIAVTVNTKDYTSKVVDANGSVDVTVDALQSGDKVTVTISMDGKDTYTETFTVA